MPGLPPPDHPFPPPMPPHLNGPPGAPEVGDVLHTNSVKVLSTALAPKFPLFKPGQVLLSLRTASMIAVLDLPTRKVVWAARGIWKSQHDAQFLDNGHLLLFDNLGSPWGSRVIEYDPVSQAVPWWYSGDKDKPFINTFRGSNQRLPNGNTLIVDSAGLRVFEVTRNKKIVWQWSYVTQDDKHRPAGAGDFTGAKRFAPAELTFLKGDARVRTK
jgi:hypothetical protein